MKYSSAAAVAAFLLELPLSSYAYTWAFKEPPTQCGQVTISISGQGQPPYSVLILPSGPTPLQNNVEARRITEVKGDASASEITFQLKFPTDSQFVAVVSDSSGFGSGGTSATVQVGASSDSSCFDSKTSVQPPWFIQLSPLSQIVQCQPSRIWWDPATVQGNPTFYGVIPGGQSFKIPQNGDATKKDNEGVGFDWTPNVRTGSTLMIVGNDDRGAGTGGSVRATVGDNVQNNNSCLNDNSPSSTAGPPAGGAYPTDKNGNTTGGNGNSGGGGGKVNIGAIVGGVVGGLLALIAAFIVLFFFRKRSKNHHVQKTPVDLLNADDDEPDHRQHLPQYYEPEPFLVPDPTIAGSDRDSEGRPLSGTDSDRPSSRTGTLDVASTSAGTRKTAPRPYRAVNIIQHDDAGPSEPKPPAEEAPETIELPPAYTNIRQ